MAKSIPILIILGLAIYSFFDVLNTKPERLRRFSKTSWLLLTLIPILGAVMWFLFGRPPADRSSYSGPRVVNLKPKAAKPVAPDDDMRFLRKVDEDLWIEKRRRQKAADEAAPPAANGPKSESAEPQPDPKSDAPDEKQSGGTS